MATTMLSQGIHAAAPRELAEERALRKRIQVSFGTAVEHTRHYKNSGILLDQLKFMESSAWLSRVPRVELVDFLKYGSRFENKKPPRLRKRRFTHPSQGKPRTALLAEGFRISFNYQRIEDYRNPYLARFKPESIAAPLDTLRALARSIESGHIWIPPLTHSVVAFAGLIEGPLSEEDLDLFWNVFKVPVHEQFYGFGGELLAWECEAHQGLHINPKAAHFEQGNREELLVSLLGNSYQPVFRLVSGLSGTLLQEPCACGLTGARIVDVMRNSQKQGKQKVLTMAAAAS